MQLITKEQLSILNRQNLKYPLAVAEKDYFLAIVSKIIFDSSIKNKLIFKGGTALHHVYLPQLRFSEDLDFSSNLEKIELNQLRDVLNNYNFLEVKKEYVSSSTIKIEKLQYSGPLGQLNSLKIEVDCLQNVVLPPVEKNYHNFYGINTKVRVMDIREIMAEKIRAMSDRARYRDFYDFVMIIKKMKIEVAKSIELVGKKEVRRTISKESILENWKIAKTEKQEDIQNIYYTESLEDGEIEIEINKLDFEPIEKLTK